jgi:23S rRNA pseudouridine2605 synthase
LSERIQKALANVGLGSRRVIERWVIDGRITIDGRVAQLGDQVQGRERVCVDGRPVKLAAPAAAHQAHQHLAYYKTGEARASRDIDGELPAVDLPRPRRGRWIDVGTLDPNSSGLLVLTTDGELAFRLMRPETLVERVYAVRLLGEPSPEQLRELAEGVELDEGRTRIGTVEKTGGGGNNFWYEVVLREGKHRELRSAFAAVGLAVSRVIRVRFGPIELGKLRRGTSRPLNSSETEALYALAGLPPPRFAAARQARKTARGSARPGRSGQGYGQRRRAASHSAK